MPKTKPLYTAKIEDIESSADTVAAEVLIIGLKHIKEHKMSHPIGISMNKWLKIVDELIWYCEVVRGEGETGGFLKTPEEQARFKSAGRLLGKYFSDIWC